RSFAASSTRACGRNGRFPPSARRKTPACCRSSSSLRDREPLFVLLIGLQDEIAHTILRSGIGDGPEQRETAAFAVHRVLPRRKRNVSAVPVAPFPDRESDQLQSLKIAVFEMELCFGELSWRGAL